MYDIQIATVSPIIDDDEILAEAYPVRTNINEPLDYEITVLQQNNNYIPFNIRYRKNITIFIILFIGIIIIIYAFS